MINKEDKLETPTATPKRMRKRGFTLTPALTKQLEGLARRWVRESVKDSEIEAEAKAGELISTAYAELQKRSRMVHRPKRKGLLWFLKYPNSK